MTNPYLAMLLAATLMLVAAANADAQDDGLALTGGCENVGNTPRL